MSIKNSLKYWNEIKKGDVLTPVVLPIPFEKVILDAAATQDFFPGHHNPDYAKNQGQKDIYLNSMAIEGIINRVATDWVGPHAFIRKRKMQIRRSVYAGDIIYGEGVVVNCYEDDGCHLVEISINLSVDDEVCIPALLTLELPFSR